jgi:hypothetical protein
MGKSQTPVERFSFIASKDTIFWQRDRLRRKSDVCILQGRQMGLRKGSPGVSVQLLLGMAEIWGCIWVPAIGFLSDTGMAEIWGCIWGFRASEKETFAGCKCASPAAR